MSSHDPKSIQVVCNGHAIQGFSSAVGIGGETLAGMMARNWTEDGPEPVPTPKDQ